MLTNLQILLIGIGFSISLSVIYFFLKTRINRKEIFENSKGESESLAGFILEVVQVFPKVGQVIKYKGFKFFIEAVDQKTIKRIKVILPPSQ